MNNVLSCFFPTTVILVDDNKNFVEILKKSIECEHIICKTFTNPKEALEYINNIASTNVLDYSSIIREGEESTSDWKSVLLNINLLHREIYSCERFLKISAIVSDYCMSDMNGIELCSSINDKRIQRILLTGIADDKKAIDAFNKGYINQFIEKGCDNSNNIFVDSIQQSIERYFRIYTNHISRYISVSGISHLNDPIFADFFHRIYSSKNYIESYMLDAFGSYLLLDANGNASMFSVLTETELSRLIDIGITSGEIANDVLQKLISREFMIVFHNRNGALPPIAEWDKYLRRAEKIDGYQTYYFSMLDYDRPDLDYDNIISFNAFKKSYSL